MLKWIAAFVAVVIEAALFFLYLRSLPLLRRLPQARRVAMEGITTLDEAVEACQRSGLRDWELTACAQNLVARKMRYSRLNSWDLPAQAFERGMGYCQQSCLALRYIYRKLGIEARPVYALKCRFPAKTIDGFPQPEGIFSHTWLRVRIGNEERDVCPGSVENVPGQTHFQVLSPVGNLTPFMAFVSYFGSIWVNIERDKAARRAASISEPVGEKSQPVRPTEAAQLK